ncbi:glucose 1-dehydrogenase [Mycolicibacterium sp. 018/SC-01/001]|uniref:SDR family NAD(P)-dependent oxidoreductase n=1 Tax=Mycolicibacterium sp. 018/SC-01/001 TaxID=2592069 RepID=UPI00118070CD|nr:glucose 1-dehydrogenase [Mycolicibacterium sp. 018/SC-01/001]TRW86304.1 glucose 1-dehydrogenase [Mycolicibacterium sp. 018/SC-01/001]
MGSRLDGKVAVVTGASKGLGAEIAREFAAEGASVVVNYAHSKDAADGVVGAISDAGGTAVAIQADMSDENQVSAMFAEAHRVFGRLDILVNNAGVYDFQPLQKLSRDLFRRHFELNVYGYLTAIKEAVGYMSPGASIVNMSSTVTIFGPSEASVYTATKGAIDALTRSLSNELAPRGIRVNAIKPGVVDTEGVQAGGFLTSDFGRALVAETPLGRLGRSEDVAPAAVYLASDESAWMTGEYITMAGGQR